MNSASLAVQEAIYQALAGDASLQTFIGNPPRLYDHYPDGPIFPFVMLGETREKDWPGVVDGLEHDVRIHAFSLYGGQYEAKELKALIRASLHDRALSLNGFHLINLRFVFADILRQRDGESWSAVLRFRAITQPI